MIPAASGTALLVLALIDRSAQASTVNVTKSPTSGLSGVYVTQKLIPGRQKDLREKIMRRKHDNAKTLK